MKHTKYACLLLRNAPYTKFRAFGEGLKKVGFEVNDSYKPDVDNILVMWNRYFRHEKIAREYENAGGKVLIAENGWIGKIDGCKPIALCLGHHNGAGTWTVGDYDRWPKCGIKLKNWREDGKHLLILPQRGFGEVGVKMPQGWLGDILKRLQKKTKREILVRMHPGVEKPKDPDFENAWASVVWASGAGIKSLAQGIPVFYEMPKWIGRDAGKEGLDQIEKPFLGDRLPMFQKLAWAQWSPVEIAEGTPFEYLLGM